jgi:hypothetical protein
MARAALVVGLAVTVGFCLLVGLGTIERQGAAPAGADRIAAGPPTPVSSGPAVESAPGARAAGAVPRTRPRQDPQDRPGTVAHRRAVVELASHRALQHVPWRSGGVAIGLVGADGRRAVLLVSGPDLAAARRGYRRFLRRYDDRGRSYLPRFRVGRSR